MKHRDKIIAFLDRMLQYRRIRALFYCLFSPSKRKLTLPLGPKQTGNAIVAVLIATGIFGMLSLGMTRMTANNMKAAKSLNLRQDLEAIKKTIRSRMDCRKTLGINPSSSLAPSACKKVKRGLKRMDGSDLGTADKKIGDWTVEAYCENDEVIFTASMPGVKDPLTGKPIDSMASNTAGTTVAVDLFGGTSNFCEAFLQPNYADCGTGTYNIYKGSRNGSKTCCREYNASSTNVGYAWCKPDEMIFIGGGNVVFDGAPTWAGAPGFFHTFVDHDTGWAVDAFSANDKYVDAKTTARAICCPRFSP